MEIILIDSILDLYLSYCYLIISFVLIVGRDGYE